MDGQERPQMRADIRRPPPRPRPTPETYQTKRWAMERWKPGEVVPTLNGTVTVFRPDPKFVTARTANKRVLQVWDNEKASHSWAVLDGETVAALIKAFEMLREEVADARQDV